MKLAISEVSTLNQNVCCSEINGFKVVSGNIYFDIENEKKCQNIKISISHLVYIPGRNVKGYVMQPTEVCQLSKIQRQISFQV